MHGDSGVAMDKATEYLARKGADTVNAFVCLEASAGDGVAEALKRAGVKDRLVVAMDADPGYSELGEGGPDRFHHRSETVHHGLLWLKGLVDVHHYPPKAKLTTEFNLESNSPFPAFVDTGVSLVDSTNVDGFLKGKPAQ